MNQSIRDKSVPFIVFGDEVGVKFEFVKAFSIGEREERKSYTDYDDKNCNHYLRFFCKESDYFKVGAKLLNVF